MKKLRKHGFKNFREAIEDRNMPHNPRVIYSEARGFQLDSALNPLLVGEIIAIAIYEGYGVTMSEYKQAVKNIMAANKK